MNTNSQINELLIMLRQARPAVLAAQGNRLTIGGETVDWQKLAEKIDKKIGNLVGPGQTPLESAA